MTNTQVTRRTVKQKRGSKKRKKIPTKIYINPLRKEWHHPNIEPNNYILARRRQTSGEKTIESHVIQKNVYDI